MAVPVIHTFTELAELRKERTDHIVVKAAEAFKGNAYR